MTEEQLAAVRLYTAGEVVTMLRLKPTWLKNWITQQRIPHVRSGAERGVCFTAEHVLEIGRMLPELLGGRRGSSGMAATQPGAGAAERPRHGPAGQQSRGDERPSPVPPAVDVTAWAQLRAHRPRPRRK
jgi:hypothetical protein